LQEKIVDAKKMSFNYVEDFLLFFEDFDDKKISIFFQIEEESSIPRLIKKIKTKICSFFSKSFLHFCKLQRNINFWDLRNHNFFLTPLPHYFYFLQQTF